MAFASPQRATVAPRLYPALSSPRTSSLLPPFLPPKMVSTSSNRMVIGPSETMRNRAAVVAENVISGARTRNCATSNTRVLPDPASTLERIRQGGHVEVVGGVGVGVPEREHGCAVLGGEDVAPGDERRGPVEHLVPGHDRAVGDAPDLLAVLGAEVVRGEPSRERPHWQHVPAVCWLLALSPITSSIAATVVAVASVGVVIRQPPCAARGSRRL
jgi:hypothetical protein